MVTFFGRVSTRDLDYHLIIRFLLGLFLNLETSIPQPNSGVKHFFQRILIGPIVKLLDIMAARCLSV